MIQESLRFPSPKAHTSREKQWERLLSDMVDVSHCLKEYFLRAIILKQTSTSVATMENHKIVIDGQLCLTKYKDVNATRPHYPRLIFIDQTELCSEYKATFFFLK